MPFDSLSAGYIAVSPPIHRLPDGSIDYAHYRRLAAAIRAAALRRPVAALASELRLTAYRTGGLIAAALDAMAAWHERARGRRLLATMDERLRRDIGITRFEVIRETSKPFWRA